MLIEAKQIDDERIMKRSISGESSSEARSKPAEFRWKCVEDYCWRKGCLRSQSQCNDKWDNLTRDYKKFRDYERKLSSSSDHYHSEVSYLKMEKNVRKEKNLPTNMLLQIFEALVEEVDKKGDGQRVIAGVGSSSAAVAGGELTGSNPNIGFVMERTITMFPPTAPMWYQISSPIPVLQPLPLPTPSLQLTPPRQPRPNSSDSDSSEYSNSREKRRRRGGNGDHQQGTNTGGTARASNS